MKALVLGGNGQDGSYLTRALLARGHRVVGVGRQAQPRLAHVGAFEHRELDLRDPSALAALLAGDAFELVLHFAAVHGSAAGQRYEARFAEMLAVNVETVHVVLEHARLHPGLRLLYASSAKAFGEPLPARIDESTPRRSTCLYGVTKNAAADLVAYYRSAHGVGASVAYLFQHESPLRPAEFFVPKLAGALAAAVAGSTERTAFHTLDFWCDWGSAEEYAEILVDAALAAPGEDFVLATGRTLHARDLASRLFAARGLRLEDHVVETSPAAGGARYQVDAGKVRSLVGRAPQRTIESVIDELVDAHRTGR
jgi:GDPmannose 4,6-dehydratase